MSDSRTGSLDLFIGDFGLVPFSMRSALFLATLPMGNTGSTAAGAAGEGGAATPPRGPNTMGKTMQQRDMAKPMAKQGAMAGSMGTGDAAAMPPGGADQPVRQAGKVAKNKAERMEKGTNPKSPMNKSNDPVRESDMKDAPAK